MSYRSLTAIIAGCVSLPVAAFAAGTVVAPPIQPGSNGSGSMLCAAAQLSEAYGQNPVQFERNDGQTDSRVKFLYHNHGSSVFLTGTDTVIAVSRTTQHGKAYSPLNPLPWTGLGTATRVTSAVHMKAVGANVNPLVEGAEELPGKVNYFIGNDHSKWHSNIPTYQQVKYADLYKNIDLVYHGNGSRLEYDFVVRPGGDPSKIALAFTGAKSMKLASTGDLRLATAAGEVTWQKPVVYQERGGVRVPVAGGYSVAKDGAVRFNVARYDAKLPLVIDPVLIFSTYLGGNGNNGDAANGIAADANGNSYAVGTTDSVDFPTTSGAYQVALKALTEVFVSKFGSTGALLYSTYIGGNASDAGRSIAVDSSGNAYVAGLTNSGNFPTQNPYQAAFGGLFDDFILKLNSSGNALIYSTFLGGSGNDGCKGIAIDSSGNAYVTGVATSTNYPVAGAYQGTLGTTKGNAFVSKIGPTGSALVYSTYLGGGGGDFGYNITVDSSNEAILTGFTQSTNFPVKTAFQGSLVGKTNAFVTKMTAAGSGLVFSTYLGGSYAGTTSILDTGYCVATDSSKAVYVVGGTSSTNFPVLNARQSALSGGADGFVSKFSATGTLVYSSFHGGSTDDYLLGCAVDSTGALYAVGATDSTDFPLKFASQASRGAAANGTITKFDSSLKNIVYSTYYGGAGDNIPFGMALDAKHNVYLGGQVDTSGLTLKNAVQGTFKNANQGTNAFIAKFLGPVEPLLWNNSSGQFSVWNLNEPGGTTISFGPFGGYTAIASATGPDDIAHVILDHTSDHQISLWAIKPDFTYTYTTYGPYPGWQFKDVTVTPNNHVHLLLDHTADHQFSIWDMSSATSYTSPSYGPYSGWAAKQITGDANNHIRLLLDHTADHQESFWDMTSAISYTTPSYGPISGWQAVSIATGPDDHLHVLWVHPADGEASYWDMTSATSYTNPSYGPFAGYTAKAISVTPDNHVHVGWEKADGTLSLWDLATPTSYTNPVYGPYQGWTCTTPGTH